MPSFVYIVESPSASDLANGRTEGRSLCEMFALSSIGHEYTLAVNLEEFSKTFEISDNSRLGEAIKKHQCAPVVHLSMHGDEDGIQLTDGNILGWKALKKILTPLNHLLPDGLLVTFSTCGGAGSIRMSMSEDTDDKPFLGRVDEFEQA